MKGRMRGGEEGVEGEEGEGGQGRRGRGRDRRGERWRGMGYLGENCYTIRIVFYKLPKTTTVSIVILISPSAVHY